MYYNNYRIKNYASDSEESDHENEIDFDKLPPLKVGVNEHKLQYTYCMWYYKPTLTKIKCSQVKTIYRYKYFFQF